MSNLQRRCKSIYQIPTISTIQTKIEPIKITDPRSPSANITRTPVDLRTYQLPTIPKNHIK